MASYHFDFRSVTVGFNGEGIHALRSGVIQRTHAWEDVQLMRVKRGMDYNNWLIMLILGGAMVICGLTLMASTFGNISRDGEWLVYFLEFNAHSITLLGLGTLIIVLALRRTMVMEIQTVKGWQRYSLREIAKKDQLRGLVYFIRRKLPQQATLEVPDTTS